MNSPVRKADVAIIGMTGRFPGADSVDQFWRNLRNGVESITFFSDKELLDAGISPDLIRDPAYVKASGVVSGSQYFDAEFFGISPAEAEIMDPQHRLFIECAWTALEDAGYGERHGPAQIGVYAGTSMSTYLLNVLQRLNTGSSGALDLRTLIGNDKDHLTTRVAYRLNLTGPAFTVQSTCSTSLVAVHLAVRGILNGECDMALAGGVSVGVPQISGVPYTKGGIISGSGHCRAFDSRADGIVGGSGVGVVVLKGLAEAVADGDRILAVIKGSAVNNDGNRKIGYSAPSQTGQARVIRAALEAAEVDPRTIGYVEAHGTATLLGDPIEIQALAAAYTDVALQSCAIGSVKSNVGHLDAAAGIAGLIKTVLCLKNAQMVPSLHVSEPNPELRLESTPFRIGTSLTSWPAGATPRRAAVSAFGIGGTNAHVILEEASTIVAEDPGTDRPQILILSARRHEALDTMADQLADTLIANPTLDLADVAYTLQAGREAFDKRRALVSRGNNEAAAALRCREWIGRIDLVTSERPVAFLFPGRHVELCSLADQLQGAFPGFRRVIDECRQLLVPFGVELRFPRGPQHSAAEDVELFVFEYALARLWMEWGIKPAALLGQGVGEYVAAALSGVLTLKTALAVAVEYSRLNQDSADTSLAKLPALNKFGTPGIPWFSTVTGDWVRGSESCLALDGANSGSERIGVHKGLCAIAALGPVAYLEVGPADDLTLSMTADPTVSEMRCVLPCFPGIRATGSAELDVWTALAHMWTLGATVDWKSIQRAKRCRRVALPTYPFERKSHWRSPVENRKPVSAKDRVSRSDDISTWFYAPVWRCVTARRRVLQPVPAPRIRCAVLHEGTELAAGLIAGLRASGADVSEVRRGTKFADRSVDGFEIDPLELRDYESLISALTRAGRMPSMFIDLASLQERPGEQSGVTCERIFALARAIVSGGPAISPDLRISVVTRGGQAVGGEVVSRPMHALVPAACRAVGDEFPQLNCVCVDIPEGKVPDDTLDTIVGELLLGGANPLSALRGTRRFLPSLESVKLTSGCKPNPVLRRGGTYLITGGLGGVGSSLAEYLARTVGANLVLVSRRAGSGKSPLHAERLEAIHSAGGNTLVIDADVASLPDMTRALAVAKNRFGRIDGIVHAAGVEGGGMIAALQGAVLNAVLRPKIEGTLVLSRLFAPNPVDFVVLCSSLASLLGAPGQAAYCIANAFLDSVPYSDLFPRSMVQSINWDTWSDAGMAFEAELPARLEASWQQSLRDGMSSAEGVEVFSRALASEYPRLAVSTRNLQSRIGGRGSRGSAAVSAETPVAAQKATRVNLRGDLRQLENTLCEIWSETLKLESLQPDDNVFQYGADSLLALQVIETIERRYSLELSPVVCYEAPTPRLLARLIGEGSPE